MFYFVCLRMKDEEMQKVNLSFIQQTERYRNVAITHEKFINIFAYVSRKSIYR